MTIRLWLQDHQDYREILLDAHHYMNAYNGLRTGAIFHMTLVISMNQCRATGSKNRGIVNDENTFGQLQPIKHAIQAGTLPGPLFMHTVQPQTLSSRTECAC
jgi:hypothetical protein